MSRPARGKLFWFGLAFWCALTGVLLLLCALPPSIHYELDPTEIRYQRGRLYTIELPELADTFAYELHADAAGANRSDLVLYEDGRPLGPPHSLHKSIAETGGGAYSHWHSALYFSTSDNSDPRSNGKRLTVEARLAPQFPLLAGAVVSCVLSILLLMAGLGSLVLWAATRTGFVRELTAEADRKTRPAASISVATVLLLSIVIMPLAARWLLLPPVYWDIDSIVLISSPLSYVPHWPWLAPVFVAVATEIFGLTHQAVQTITVLQIIFYAVCLLVFAAGFRSLLARLVAIIGTLAQFYMLLIAGAVSTEPIGCAALLLSLGAAVAYMERVAQAIEISAAFVVRSLVAFGVCIFFAANTRLPMLPLSCLFPSTVALYLIGSRFRCPRVGYHLAVLLSCGALAVLAIAEASVASIFVCRLASNVNCESPYGRSGSEMVAFALRRLAPAERDREVRRLQALTTDPLVKAAFAAAADDAVVPSWVEIQQAIAANSTIAADPVLAARARTPGELERITGAATWLFQTRGGQAFWTNVYDTAANYLNAAAIRQIASGETNPLFDLERNFARAWLAASAGAVRTAHEYHPESVGVFGDSGAAEKEYIRLRDDPVVEAADIVSGPIVGEFLFLLVCGVFTVACFARPAVRSAGALCGATLIVVGGYSLIMAASVGPVLDRYRMPSSFLLSAVTFAILGLLLDAATQSRAVRIYAAPESAQG